MSLFVGLFSDFLLLPLPFFHNSLVCQNIEKRPIKKTQLHSDIPTSDENRARRHDGRRARRHSLYSDMPTSQSRRAKRYSVNSDIPTSDERRARRHSLYSDMGWLRLVGSLKL